MTNPTPSMTLAETVRIEAMASVRRRELARQTGTVVQAAKGPGAKALNRGWIGDQIRQIAADLDAAEQLARRNEAMAKLRTPSGLIRRMREEWPAQAGAVKALAEARGIDLGEAWAEVIAAGVASIDRRRR